MTKKIVVSVSGWKDSTACLIIALSENRKEDVIPVFVDTGWEHPLTYQYLEYLESELGIKIVRVKSEKYKNVLDVIEKKKIFPSSRIRFCSQYLKREPLHKWIAENFDVESTEMWLGLRVDESIDRKKRYSHLSDKELYRFVDVNPTCESYVKDLKVRFPVLFKTSNEIYKIITNASLEINPLYHKGFDRVGCFPCVIAGLKDYKKVWNDDVGKQNIIKLVKLEEKLNEKGYAATLKPDKSGKEILEMLKLRDNQFILFYDNDDSKCGFCHY
ncbi:phosphoadenosine phosphosulfate reductase domain-containing protein [Persephonella sp.]